MENSKDAVTRMYIFISGLKGLICWHPFEPCPCVFVTEFSYFETLAKLMNPVLFIKCITALDK